jgi:hypothetical protein
MMGPAGQPVPHCPSCKKTFEAGTTWTGANYCRGLALAVCIKDKPGLSAWELSKASGIAYGDVHAGLLKLRDFGVVSVESEERATGGERYRYYATGDPAARARFLEALRRVEALA